MNIYNWIFTAVFGILAILYTVSSIIKNKILRRVSSFSLLPVTAGYAASFLLNYFPDSMHITLICMITFFTISLSVIFCDFDTKKLFFFLGVLFTYVTSLCWTYLYGTIFYLYHVPQFVLTISIITYIAIIIAFSIFAGKQNKTVYLILALSVLITGTLHYCSFITLCYERSLYGILLFSGATVLMGFIIYLILDRYKFHFKHSMLIKFLLPAIAQILISTSSILMIR